MMKSKKVRGIIQKLIVCIMLLSMAGCGGKSGSQDGSGNGRLSETRTLQNDAEESKEEESPGTVELSGPAELPEPGEVVMSGRWGETVTYTLDNKGILTISGTGKMSKIEGEEYPDDNSIIYLVVQEGVESVVHFSENPNLRYVSLPSTVKVIGDSRFQGCSGLTTVILAEGICELKNYAFSGCSSLASIVLPSTVYRLGMYAFGNTGLTEIGLPEEMFYIDNSFSGSALVNIKWPSGVNTIYTSTFYKCQGLTSISLPKDVISIRDGAFKDCASLKDIYYEGTEEDFKKIEIGEENEDFLNAVVHYSE